MKLALRDPIMAWLAVASTASAVFLQPFLSWEILSEKSPDIVIARCTPTPAPKLIKDGMIWSEIEVVSVLKGDTKPARARMVSQYWPYRDEQFLMFGTYQSNELYSAYNAAEKYRIVLLPASFDVSQLAGK